MAGLWTPSGLDNNRVALAFNNMLYNEIISITRRRSGLWYAITANMEIGSFEDGRIKFSMVEEITGFKMEITFRGKRPTINKAGLGSPEVALRGTSYDGNIWGGYEFDLAHYWYHQDIPLSEYSQLRGNEAKTESALEAYRDYVAEGYQEDLSNDIHGNTTQSQTTIAGLPFVVSTTTSYAFDRTNDANAKFRSQVDDASSSALTRHMLGVNQKKCLNAGGEPTLGVTNIENLQDIDDLVQDRIHAYSDEMWDEFGGQHVRYGQTVYVMDDRSAASTVYHLDPNWWKIVKNEMGMAESGIILDPSTVGSYVLQTHMWLGTACAKPFAQGSIINLG